MEPVDSKLTRRQLAQTERDRLLFSTYFIVREVAEHLGDPALFDIAVQTCKQNGLLRVYLETFRDGVYADENILARARDRFRDEGIDVWGVVCTNGYGKPSTTLSHYPCLTAEKTRSELAAMFRFTAELFDKILIDEYIWSHCRCDECQQAKGGRSWKVFRCEQMREVCREFVIDAARSVRPNARLLYKFPSPFEVFAQQGQHINMMREIFDGIWSGTEVGAFFDSPQDPLTSQGAFRSYWLTRWMNQAGRGSTGGAWIMPLQDSGHFRDTSFQTILARPKELILHPYGGMAPEYQWVFPGGGGQFPDFMKDIPLCFELTRIIDANPPRGLAAVCPVDAEPWEVGEAYDANVFDVVGQLGLPLLPEVDFFPDAEGHFLSLHLRSLEIYPGALHALAATNAPTVVTNGLADTLATEFLKRDNVQVLQASVMTPFLFDYRGAPGPYGKMVQQKVVPAEDSWNALLNEDGWDASLGYSGNPELNARLLNMPQDELDALRNHLLQPFGYAVRMPSRVALMILGQDYLVLHNFRDEAVPVVVGREDEAAPRVELTLPSGNAPEIVPDVNGHRLMLPAHCLVCLRWSR